MAKRFLFIVRSFPHGAASAQEALDVILTTAAMEQPVSVLFLEDGVLQLLDEQNPALVGLKHIAPIYQSLPIYDVESFWVERESLEARGIADRKLILPVDLIHRSGVAGLIESHDITVTC